MHPIHFTGTFRGKGLSQMGLRGVVGTHAATMDQPQGRRGRGLVLKA